MHRTGLIARFCAFLVSAVLLLGMAQPAGAQALCPVLDLTGPMRGETLAGYIGALEDPGRARVPGDLARVDAPGFVMLDSASPDYGYTASNIWLRLCLRNRTGIADWRLNVNENFFQVFEVYLDRADGTGESVVTLTPDSLFTDRPVPDPQLIAPLRIAPDEVVTLVIGYRSGGASQMDFSLETLDSFNALTSKRTAKNFIFYGMVALLVTVAVVSFLLVRHVVFLAYGGYVAAALLFVMHGDGVAFQYLWPTLPGFNGIASIFTGGGLIVTGAIFARVFLQTAQRHPHIDRLLLGIIVATLGLTVVLIIPNPQLLKKLLIIASLGSILVFAGAGLYSYLSGYRDVRFYVLAWLGAVVASGLLNLRHVVGLEISQEAVYDAIRVVIVLDAMMMGLAIADRYNQMRRSRQAALEGSLEATRQRLELNQRLADLQARHELAVELAKSRDRHIQNVVHDLRQPLHALRLNVMTLTAEAPGRARPVRPQTVEAAFTYLETLIAEHLEPEVEGFPATISAVPSASQPDEKDAALDPPGLQDILAAVADMFQPDAEAKGLYLRHAPNQIDLSLSEPLVLTRILSNLVSNAIKYTDSGGVLIAARRRGETVRIEIHDTGPGMSEAEFIRAAGRNIRLAKSRRTADGKGLGLAIAIDLATRHGMHLVCLEGRRDGTGLGLVLPV